MDREDILTEIEASLADAYELIMENQSIIGDLVLLTEAVDTAIMEIRKEV